MGIFDDIIAPVKDLINGLQKPIHTVENIFGEVIDMTEQLISSIRDMISDMENLFNAHSVETMFLAPFADAALAAVKDVETLYALISSVSSVVIDGVGDVIMTPIKATYNLMHRSMDAMLNTLGSVMKKMANDASTLTHKIHGDFARLKALIQSIPVEIGILGRKIRTELAVIGEDAFQILPDFPDMLEKDGNIAFSAVKKVGTVVAADFSGLEVSLKRRLDNESAVLDLFYLVVIGGILAVIVSIFMVTHSVKIIIILLVIFVVSLMIFVLSDLIIGSV